MSCFTQQVEEVVWLVEVCEAGWWCHLFHINLEMQESDVTGCKLHPVVLLRKSWTTLDKNIKIWLSWLICNINDVNILDVMILFTVSSSFWHSSPLTNKYAGFFLNVVERFTVENKWLEVNKCQHIYSKFLNSSYINRIYVHPHIFIHFHNDPFNLVIRNMYVIFNSFTISLLFLIENDTRALK